MHPRVTAILVARDGEPYLRRTIDAIAAQTRAPELLIAVDAGSSDASAALLTEAGAAQVLRIEGRPSFGTAVQQAVHLSTPSDSGPNARGPVVTDADEWLWLLAHDNAPEPGALAALLAAVEVAPSVAIAGTKLMRADEPGVIAEYGETMTRTGASVVIVRDELDQGQHDNTTDVLAVAAGGMLVRRSVWTALGGFDPALPSIDAALDLCVRARLAGHRVAAVPAARVTSAGSPALFGRRTRSGAAQHRIGRAAQLHRRLAYSPAAALPIHWLSLLPLAVLRSLWHLIAKRPELIPGEFATALTAAFAWHRVVASRRNLRRHRRLGVGWDAIRPLRMPPAAAREHRAHERDVHDRAAEERLQRTAHVARERPDFFSGGGAWMVLLAAVAGAIAVSSFAGQRAVTGGGLVPLGATPAVLWDAALSGWREIGIGFIGAADPFTLVVAVLGSITFWEPSQAIVGLYLVALPLSAFGAWLAVARWSHRSWAPNLAALIWAFAPPLLTSLNEGRLGAVLVHLLLPWLVFAGTLALRSWPAAASTALLSAVIIAAAPVLGPALIGAWLVSMAARPKAIPRLLFTPVPALVLFIPLIIDQLRRGTPLALFADPGVPALGGTDSGWQLALGAPELGLHGWSVIAAALDLPGISAAVLVAVLTAPLVLLAALSMFLRGSSRSVFALVLALLGYVTAVASAHLAVTAVDDTATMIWPGSALSLYWLGLMFAAAGSIDALSVEALRRAVPPVVIATGIALIALVAPTIAAPALGTATVQAGEGRMLPAYVTAEAGRDPQLGTVLLTPLADGEVSVALHRGAGATLEQQSTLASTRVVLDDDALALGELGANLIVPSGFDADEVLQRWKVGFVVLAPPPVDATEDGRERHRVAAQTLDRDERFVAVGETAAGLLWRYVDTADGELERPDAGSRAGAWAIALVIVFGVTLLLAAPTGRRPRRIRRTDASGLDLTDDGDEVFDGRA